MQSLCRAPYPPREPVYRPAGVIGSSGLGWRPRDGTSPAGCVFCPASAPGLARAVTSLRLATRRYTRSGVSASWGESCASFQCACPSFLAAAAATTTVTAEEIRDTLVVTASRIPVPLVAAGSSVSVIDREQIEARQSVFAVDLLQDVPGFAVSRSGSIGSQTQVRVRGAEANQVLVLIDGIEANDPAGNDEFAFQDLTTWDVERIEVVRGPQSALWGSDALAGVVNVITRQPTEEFSAERLCGRRVPSTPTAVAAACPARCWGRGPACRSRRLDSNGSNSSRTGTRTTATRTRRAR